MSLPGASHGEVKERLHSGCYGAFLIVNLNGEGTPRALDEEHFRFSVKAFPARINRVGMNHSECGQYRPVGQSHGLSEKGRRNSSLKTSSLCFPSLQDVSKQPPAIPMERELVPLPQCPPHSEGLYSLSHEPK